MSCLQCRKTEGFVEGRRDKDACLSHQFTRLVMADRAKGCGMSEGHAAIACGLCWTGSKNRPDASGCGFVQDLAVLAVVPPAASGSDDVLALRLAGGWRNGIVDDAEVGKGPI